MTLRDETTRELHRIALDRQRKGRIPGVLAGVARDGGLVWHDGIGAARLDEPDLAPGPDDQFLVASNTKTFTAAMVMQLRDEGRLTLDDTLDRLVPEVGHAGLSIRQCLAHVSGMQREPLGDVWEHLDFPDRAQLVSDFNEAERVHPPHRLWHYSNLVYSLLGEAVARLDGRDWYSSLRARILDPLEMRRTTVGFDGPHADGYFVPPYSDVPVAQPPHDLRALDPCAGLASTGADLARWSSFVAEPVAEVLSPDTVEEMCQPQTLIDREGWTTAMGLGFFLVRSGTRTYVGHTGGMPGHITALFTDRTAGTGGLALTNSGTSPDIAGFAIAAGRRAHRPRAGPARAVASRHRRAGRARRPDRGLVDRGQPVHVLGAAGPAGGAGALAAGAQARPPASSRSGPTCSAPSPAARRGSFSGSPATRRGVPRS